MDEETKAAECVEVVGYARILQHLRDPQNLLVYLCVSAWAKFMGVAEHLPSITVG